MAAKTKGIKLYGTATVVRTGTACVGQMPWESPYIVVNYKGNEYRWHADSCPETILQLNKGDLIQLEAFAYSCTLRRVKITQIINNGKSFIHKA